jgi:riboflavin synthase alpha subunit
MSVTTFKNLAVGDRVNLEFDMIGKYVERLLKSRSRRRMQSRRI